MKKQNVKMKAGFTIIEVVLVLAIAGLIFLMVFVALPALQRSQRDTQRRSDMSRVDTALIQYQTNHTTGANVTSLPKPGHWLGKLSFAEEADCKNNSACSFIREYMNTGANNAMDNLFTDPTGNPYNMCITQNWSLVAPQGCSSFGNGDSVLTVEDGKGTLTGTQTYESHTIYIMPGARCEGADAVVGSPASYAIMYRLEGSGIYCMDDQ